jgi:hypothetical protein
MLEQAVETAQSIAIQMVTGLNAGVNDIKELPSVVRVRCLRTNYV